MNEPIEIDLRALQTAEVTIQQVLTAYNMSVADAVGIQQPTER